MTTVIRFIFGALTLFVAFQQSALSASEGPLELDQIEPRLNIIFIMTDDHASQAIGAYGSRLAPLDPTPNIDQLAEEGIVFDNVFVTNSICTPSRATIMTGQYSQANGVLDLADRLPVNRQHLPRLMSQAGYYTAIIGKWHLKEEPAAFDYYKVLPGQGDYFHPEFRIRGDQPWPNNVVAHRGHSTDVITDQALDWLESRGRAKPFFLMLQYKAPHDLYEFAPRYKDYLSGTEIPEPANLYTQPGFGSVATRGEEGRLASVIGTSVSRRNPDRNMGRWVGIDPSLSESEYTHQSYQEYLKRYLRTAKGVDDNIGRLVEYLKKSALYDKTIIVYTSDQGLMLGEHDLIDKRWMYEESLRMPFIVRYPNKEKAPRRSDLLINNTDFAPTLLDLAGSSTPDYMHGRSFAAVFDNVTPPDWRQATYYRFWMHRAYHDVPAHLGLRTKRYKLIFFYGLDYKSRKILTKDDYDGVELPRGEYYGLDTSRGELTARSEIRTPPGWEFYDLKRDADEIQNRYDDPAYAETIAELKIELAKLRSEFSETDEKYPEIEKVVETFWD